MLIRNMFRKVGILVCLSLVVMIGVQAYAQDKIPSFGTIKASDVKDAYYVFNDNGTAKKIRMSEVETIMLARMFNMNNYVDNYVPSDYAKTIDNPHIEIHINSKEMMEIYTSTNGFVYVDNNKQYYVNTDKFSTLFGYCYSKYVSKVDNIKLPSGKYKPVLYDLDGFLSDIKKYKCIYKVLDTVSDERTQSLLTTIEMFRDKVSVLKYKDNIDMEFGAMQFDELNETLDWVKTLHIFKKGDIIVYYVGDNDDIVHIIENVMGKKFLG